MALLAVGCSQAGPVGRTPAATVNGTSISQESVIELVEAEETFIRAAAAAQDLDEATLADALSRFTGPSPGTLVASASADKVSLLIGLEIFRDVVEREEITVTEAHRASASGQLESELQSQGLGRDAIPAVLFDLHLERLAHEQAISESAPVMSPPSEAELQEIYDDQVDDYTQLCMIGIVVDPSVATDAADRIEAGEDPAAVAEDLGGQAPADAPECVATADMAAVYADAYEAEVGAVVGPLEFQDGSWVLRVESIDVPSLDDIRDQLLAPLEEQGAQAGQAYVAIVMREALARAEVEVDPRFGRWNPLTGMVDAPVDPNAPAATDPIGLVPAP